MTSNHPVELKLDNVMSFDELRHWISELLDNPAYGIANVIGGKAALERAMGVAKGVLRGKLRGGWIYPSEQIRLTRIIMQVRNGEIVLRQDPLNAKKAYFIVQDPPNPPVVASKQVRWAWNGAGRMTKVGDPAYQPALPSLQGALDRAKVRP